MNAPLFLFSLGTTILLYAWGLHLKTPAKGWWEYARPKTSYESKYKDSANEKLLSSYVKGVRRGVPRDFQRKHERLGLLHLQTPSGLHLSVVWYLILPLFLVVRFLFPVRRVFLEIFLALGAVLYLHIFTYSLAMQRMSILRLLLVSCRLNDWHLYRQNGIIWPLFFLTFILSIVLGNFSKSPLSFALSFLFLGMILASKGSKWQLALGLISAQAFVQGLFIQPFSFIGSSLGLVLTPLFTFLFPFMLLDHFFLARFFSFNFEFILTFYRLLISWAYDISLWEGEHIRGPLWGMGILFLAKTQWGKFVGIMILLTAPEPVLNLPRSAYLEAIRTPRETRHRLYFPPENMERTRRGYKTWNEREVCYHRLLIRDYSRSCRRS